MCALFILFFFSKNVCITSWGKANPSGIFVLMVTGGNLKKAREPVNADGQFLINYVFLLLIVWTCFSILFILRQR